MYRLVKGKDGFDCSKGHFAQPVAVVRMPGET
jgi:hypothetical protein